MATTINANNTDGVIITPDTSGEIALQANGVTKATIGSSGLYSTGHVLQVVTLNHTTAFSTSSATFVDVTDLTLSITPSSTSSKILVMVTVNAAHTNSNSALFRLLRNSTPIGGGVAKPSSSHQDNVIGTLRTTTNYHTHVVSYNYLDSPSTTSATTYKIQTLSTAGLNPTYVNRTINDSTSEFDSRNASSIVLMEIAG